jgi:hypothetical protein
LVLLAAWIVLLPFYLLFKLLGLALKIGFAGIFVAFFGILLLPIALVVGAVLFLKLLIIGIPLLIAFLLFSFLVGFFRRDERRTIYVEAPRTTSS